MRFRATWYSRLTAADEWLFQESGISPYLDGDQATWFDPSASGPWAPALDIAMYLIFSSAPKAPLSIYQIDVWTGTPG